jgi:methyl-accepting chemotaxis protein
MLWFTKTSINRKLTMIILSTCTAVLLLAGLAMIATEIVTSRRAMVEDMTVLADVLGRHSTPALSFHRDEDAEEVKRNLASLQADPHILIACLFDKERKRFGDYARPEAAQAVPDQPSPDGHRFTSDYLELSHPVESNQKRIGTIYLRIDLGRMYRQVALHAGIVGMVFVGIMVLASVLSARLRRPITEPILTLAGVAKRVAESKDYSARAPKCAQDEIGLLTDAFNQMLSEIEKGQSSLESANQSKEVEIAERRATEERLKGQTREVVESINVLVSSASEILETCTRLASGAAQTATAVSQTTATVEEVRQTVLVSSQKAMHVAENAQRVVQTSLSGKKSTDDTIEGMQRIRQQVESTADSMVRLSEQTQAIGQIVATVEDLAVESNILAVNASIEAAKAGEQGKGFAVVAQEVRSLAEQSRQATNQVRNILNDIQKATSAAVMATEQGSKAVEAGVMQSREAGQSIQTLSNNVSEAAQVATHIAASSQQQLVGVDQVASAMESIRHATTQNLTSAKQLEAAAHKLKELGQNLKRTVERYEV